MITVSLLSDVLLVAIVSAISVHALKLYLQRRWLLFDPLNTFWGGVIVCYVLQPITYKDTFVAWHSVDIFETTLLWIFVAVCGVVCGYEVEWGRHIGHRLPRLPVRLDRKRLERGALLMVLIGSLSYVYVFWTAGGLWEWLAVGRGGTDYQNTSGYLAQAEALLPLGLALLVFGISKDRVALAKKVVVWPAVTVMWLWYVYIGSRSRVIVFSLTIVAVWCIAKRRNPPIVLALAGGIVLLLITNFQEVYRYTFQNLSFNLNDVEATQLADSVLPSWLGGDKEQRVATGGLEFNCVMTVVELVPQQIEYNYGYSHLQLFTQWIPRSIWPAKRYPHYESFTPLLLLGTLSQHWVDTSEVPVLAGPAFTFVGHWYAVGGPVALLLAAFFSGMFFKMIRTILDRSNGGSGDILMFITLMPLGFGEAAGEPLFFLYSLPITILPLIALIHVCGRSNNRNQLRWDDSCGESCLGSMSIEDGLAI